VAAFVMTRTPDDPRNPDEPPATGEPRDARTCEPRDARTCERAEAQRVAALATLDAHHVDADEVNDATYDDDVDDDDTPAVLPAPVRDREQRAR